MESLDYTTDSRFRSAGEWIDAFLTAYRNSGNVRFSCEKAGITRKTAYDRRDADPIFRAAWEEAHQDALDIIEGVAAAKAQAGDNAMIILFLKSHRRSVYGDSLKSEVSGPGGGPIQTQAVVTADDLETVPTEELRDIEQRILAAVARGREANAVPPQPA